MGGHTDAEGVGEVGLQGQVEQAVVVRVGLGLGQVGRLGPALDLGVDALHGEVGTLDQADLERGAAGGVAGAGEVGDPLEGGRRVGQVGLQDDAGGQVPELGLVDQPGEQVDGQLEVVVLLHVEVDEDPVGLRGAVDGAQALLEALEAAGVVPVLQLGAQAGGLDGYVGDARVLDELDGAARAVARLLLAEDELAEEVEVELLAGLGGPVEAVAQGAALDVEDEVGDQLAHAGPGGGHDQARGDPAGLRTDGQQCGVDGAQEGRGDAVGDLVQGLGCGGVVGGTGDAVDEVHGEAHALGVAQDRGELLGGAGLRAGFRVGGQPLVGAGDGVRHGGVDVGGVRRRGGGVGGVDGHFASFP